MFVVRDREATENPIDRQSGPGVANHIVQSSLYYRLVVAQEKRDGSVGDIETGPAEITILRFTRVSSCSSSHIFYFYCVGIYKLITFLFLYSPWYPTIVY